MTSEEIQALLADKQAFDRRIALERAYSSAFTHDKYVEAAIGDLIDVRDSLEDVSGRAYGKVVEALRHLEAADAALASVLNLIEDDA